MTYQEIAKAHGHYDVCILLIGRVVAIHSNLILSHLAYISIRLKIKTILCYHKSPLPLGYLDV